MTNEAPKFKTSAYCRNPKKDTKLCQWDFDPSFVDEAHKVEFVLNDMMLVAEKEFGKSKFVPPVLILYTNLGPITPPTLQDQPLPEIPPEKA